MGLAFVFEHEARRDDGMPDHEACEAAVAALRRQHERLGELLRQIEDGRWWPDDRAGHEDADAVLAHARRIEASLGEIARIFVAMSE